VYAIGDACDKDKASAPFKKLRMFQDKLFLQWHLPRRFVFPDDPSHMTTGDATRFLTFIRKRQEEHPEDIFEFQHWLKDNRLMKPGNPDDEGEDADGSHNGSMEGNTSETFHQAKEKMASSAVHDTHQAPDWITGAQTAEGYKSGLHVADNTNAKPIIADEDEPPAKGRSKGKERADVIPGSRKRVADMTDPVSNVAEHKGDTASHPDHSAQASSPQAAYPQTSSLRHPTTGKKPSSKGKRKADVGKSVRSRSQGSAMMAEPSFENPASAGLDDGNPITFSMRPPMKSIVQQEKERLKGSVASRQPTPGPSTASLVKGSGLKPTSGPSSTDGHRQKKTGPSVEKEKMVVTTTGTEHGPDQGTDPPMLH
jgi:hypothetical protein